MRYFIISQVDRKNLTDEVNEWIEKGWLPLGGAIYTGSSWAQTMTFTPK